MIKRLGLSSSINNMLFHWHKWWLSQTNPLAPADVICRRIFKLNSLNSKLYITEKESNGD